MTFSLEQELDACFNCQNLNYTFIKISRATKMDFSDVTATTTGSFQNQPTQEETTVSQRKCTRKRGVACVL